MKRPYLAWYIPVGLLAIAPVSIRVLSWRAPAPANFDTTMVRAGQVLFHHDWTPRDPLAHGGDGLGPVFNDTSCVACHNQGGPGGGGGIAHNVTTFTIRPQKQGEKAREGVVHSHAVKYQETLAQVHPALPSIPPPELGKLLPVPGCSVRAIPFPPGVHLSQRNTPALFGIKLIDELPEREIIANERRQQLKWGMASADVEDAPVGRAMRLADGRLGRFGWKAQMASLSDFVQAACANELGLGNPGQAQPRPLGRPDYAPSSLDLTTEQCQQITAFVASLPRPVERVKGGAAAQVQNGKKVFCTIGCADCHTPNLGSIEGLYSDLLLHRMGQTLEGGGSYGEPPVPLPEFSPGEGPRPDEWRTPPLWGVADSAPYMHDGRAGTLEDAIHLHAGQAARAAHRYANLSSADQTQLIAFLKSLRAPLD
jgi:CxxC motif-containing protein (DUF1111 family)